MPRNSALRTLLVVVPVLAVGWAGLHFGMKLRDRVLPPMEEGMLTPPSRLAAGNQMPDVPLVAEDGTTTSTHRLLEGRGGVVLFLEVGCPPCSVMVKRWESAREQPGLRTVPIFGIAGASRESIRAYKLSRHFVFPIYSDVAGTFEREYQVTGFPLRVVVGRSLVVRAHSFDAKEKVEPRTLLAQIRR